jgi:hypothetical protein
MELGDISWSDGSLLARDRAGHSLLASVTSVTSRSSIRENDQIDRGISLKEVGFRPKGIVQETFGFKLLAVGANRYSPVHLDD